MEEVDIFGFKFGGKSKSQYAKKVVEYEIPKKKLLEALDFEEEEVTFIQYDYKKGVLHIKTK